MMRECCGTYRWHIHYGCVPGKVKENNREEINAER